ncbi:MAG: hypothetical protein IPO35_16580 [Uliginosibacterium sp.]|jgi:hypothetical protein|nr:hypothetical protein [Uliginosibacterium sp.]MBK9393654.1 hypothetical protein [Uliginosibacterium sp.]MBK9617041.1 hypothetical protein [Uliginosibacterium sp.]
MSFRDFVHEAGQAARVNLVPGLILQAVAISLLAAYYLIPAVRPGFDWFAHLKQDWGYGYSALATAISGGIVPFLYLWLRGSIKHGVGKALLFYIVFWALMGMQVDVLYRFQGELFGQGNELAVLIPKVLVDQGLFTPLWSIPLTTLCYLWKNLDFNFAALRGKIDRKLFLHDIPGMIVPAWMVWLPAVTVIYCLPGSLQIPMFNLVLCFWSLLAEVVNARQNRKQASHADR